MRVLNLSLKKRWFYFVKAGIKLEEYREITPYWIKRLLEERVEDKGRVVGKPITEHEAKWYAANKSQLLYDIAVGRIAFKLFSHVLFTLGYPKRDDTDRHTLKRVSSICIGKPKEGWAPDEYLERDFLL